MSMGENQILDVVLEERQGRAKEDDPVGTDEVR